MTKSERLLRLLTVLQGRRTVITARALAELLEVSERTVYRDVQSLVLSGVPVEGEAGVGYRLRGGATLPPLMFSQDEMEALLLGVRMVQGWADDDLSQAAQSALDKIRSVLPDLMVHTQNMQPAQLLVPALHRPEKTRHAAVLRRAIKEQVMVRLDYEDQEGQPSQRTVCSLGLMYWGAAWTLVAWCQLRDAHRLFRLDRIRSLELLPEHFYLASHQSLQSYVQQFKPDFNGKAF